MPNLSDQIKQLILAEGPITIAQYMEEALGHPRLGYYMAESPFGCSGDFITAPEISQMFGELIGLWLGVQWRAMGALEPFNLIELGPGRGTLMSDILRVSRGVDGFLESLDLSLVEISPMMKGLQEDTLLDSIGNEVRRVRALRWISQFTEVPEGPFAVIANEFIDVLGIRQFQKTSQGWRERLIDISESEPYKFHFVISGSSPKEGIVPSDLKNVCSGDIIEVRPAASDLIHEISCRLKRNRGCVLIIDYGHNMTACGDTLQAVKSHASHDPMVEPGTADITAHVDFGALCKVATNSGASVFGPVTQGDFLNALGIQARASVLTQSSPSNAHEITDALSRLTSENGMGSLFKVLAITSPGLLAPPGF